MMNTSTPEVQAEWTPCHARGCVSGYEWSQSGGGVFLRCAICKALVLSWSLDDLPPSFPMQPHCLSPQEELLSKVRVVVENVMQETVRATAFAYYYTHIRERRMEYRDEPGEPIESPNEKELKLVADDAMILADDAAKKYAERLAKRAATKEPA